jgi:hypothetical protein
VADDDVEVVAVQIRILKPDGAVLEEGPATPGSGGWFYETTTFTWPHLRVTLEATAKDRPGNATKKTEVWP